MDINDLLTDAFGRVREGVRRAVDGLTPELLAFRPGEQANSIAWLVWHLTRVQDDHVADVARVEQVWTGQGWVGRFALPFAASDTGYGHGNDEVAAVRVEAGNMLLEYHEAVFAQTVQYVRGLVPTDLDRIVDDAWDPPVSLGVRLISVIADDLEHVGQAAYLRGLIEHPAP